MKIILEKSHIISNSELQLELTEQTVRDGTESAWEVENTGNQVFEGVFRLKVLFPKELSRPWIMVPGFFYGENRRANQYGSKLYPRYDADLTEPSNMESSWWDFSINRTAIPLVYAYENENCAYLVSEPHYNITGEVASDDPELQPGIGFGHEDDRFYARFSYPACEEPFHYTTAPNISPRIRRLRIAPGARVAGTLRGGSFSGRRHDYQSIIEETYSWYGDRYKEAPLPEINALLEDAAYGIVEWHYVPEQNYFIYSRPYAPVIEQIANAGDLSMEWHQMQIGFVGGMLICNGLLQDALLNKNELSHTTARAVADHYCRNGISPSGLFWAGFTPKVIHSSNGDYPNPRAEGRDEWGSGWLKEKTWVHSRTIADGCVHLTNMLITEAKINPKSSSIPLWQEALKSNLSTAMDLQLPDGRYGQYYDAVEKRVVKKDGCGGLLWIPAMIRAIKLEFADKTFNDRMRDSILRAAKAYSSAVEEEYIWGAPEDNDSPTSEDGMNAVMAYCELYEFDPQDRWLNLAVQAADWMLTFRKSYNETFPAGSIMQVYDMRSRGGDYASSSNNHLHVFEVLVSRHLKQLSKWTGKKYYIDRAREHWAFACQHLSRCDGMYNGFRGAIAEQFYWCEFGSYGNSCHPHPKQIQKGHMSPCTAVWCGAVLMVAAPDALKAFGNGTAWSKPNFR